VTRAYLVDGTYELFRHFFGAPPHRNSAGQEVGATRAVLGSLLGMLEGGVTHMGVATDHVIESWRNQAWPSYKSSEGVAPELLGQFGRFEEAMRAMGVLVWPMVELEADDALASAAAALAPLAEVSQVLICTPDKDLGQCVQGERVVCLDRRKQVVLDETGVTAKFGVPPASVPDWLALVGDSADGYPGVPGWGPKAASAVLGRYGHIEQVPARSTHWDGVSLGAGRSLSLASSLLDHRELALLFKRLATCTIDPGLLPADREAMVALKWRGPGPGFKKVAETLDAPALARRAELAAARLNA
jgi:5'-3' exonuclease